MANAKDTRKAAREMLARFGDLALKEVELRVHELHQLRQFEAQKFWLEVRRSIVEEIRRRHNTN